MSNMSNGYESNFLSRYLASCIVQKRWVCGTICFLPLLSLLLLLPLLPLLKYLGAVLVGRELKSSGISRINILFEIDYDKVVINTPGADTR